MRALRAPPNEICIDRVRVGLIRRHSSEPSASPPASQADGDGADGVKKEEGGDTPAPAPGAWQTFFDQFGRPYYYNAATNTTQWTAPPGASRDSRRRRVHLRRPSCSAWFAHKPRGFLARAGVLPPGAVPPPMPPPGGPSAPAAGGAAPGPVPPASAPGEGAPDGGPAAADGDGEPPAAQAEGNGDAGAEGAEGDS